MIGNFRNRKREWRGKNGGNRRNGSCGGCGSGGWLRYGRRILRWNRDGRRKDGWRSGDDRIGKLRSRTAHIFSIRPHEKFHGIGHKQEISVIEHGGNGIGILGILLRVPISKMGNIGGDAERIRWKIGITYRNFVPPYFRSVRERRKKSHYLVVGNDSGSEP